MDYYEVHRKQVGVSGFTLIASPSSSNYTDNGIFVNQNDSETFQYKVRAVNTNGDESYFSSTVTIDGDPSFQKTADNSNLPEEYDLANNYPNPFNPSTQIKFSLPEAADVNLKVYNLMGQEVTTLVNSNITAGNHIVNFDASSLSSGMYIAKIQAIGESGDVFSKEIKMQLIK